MMMQHRHLLPNEIDLVLDADVGFGAAPLREHLDACADCRGRVADARRTFESLDALPRFAPRPSFADRVMANVQVVEPLHVAALDAVKRYVPKSAPMRVAMAASATIVATGISGAAIWLAFRTDVALYLAGAAGERVRTTAGAWLEAMTSSVLGAGAADAIRGMGPAGLAGIAAVGLGSAAFAAYGLRALATASRQTRE